MKREVALQVSGLSKHQYYYRPRIGRVGRKKTTTTFRVVGQAIEEVANSEVVAYMQEIKSDPDTDYGYHKMTWALKFAGFIINHKKVERLMGENHLLQEKKNKPLRNFVQYRQVNPQGPLQHLEMDIKFVWVEEYRRHAFIMSVIDTFTRVILGWQVAYQIMQDLVKLIWERIIENHLQPNDCLSKKISIEIRNDNDSRFIAQSVQNFFQQNHLNQVFTHPYTPQENGHIESFHAILSKMLERYNFWSLSELETTLTLFYEKYNNHRLHSATAYLPPMKFWELWNADLITEKTNVKSKRKTFKLKVPPQQLLGDLSLREVPCIQQVTLEGLPVEKDRRLMTPDPTTIGRKSPSVVPCEDNSNENSLCLH